MKNFCHVQYLVEFVQCSITTCGEGGIDSVKTSTFTGCTGSWKVMENTPQKVWKENHRSCSVQSLTLCAMQVPQHWCACNRATILMAVCNAGASALGCLQQGHHPNEAEWNMLQNTVNYSIPRTRCWTTVPRAWLHCVLAAAQCIVIGPVCLFVAGWVGVCVCVWMWVCYHDNSKLHASTLAKLGL